MGFRAQGLAFTGKSWGFGFCMRGFGVGILGLLLGIEDSLLVSRTRRLLATAGKD